ncbi:L,D-transpeptidase [Candidatus Roizmanbacteria bacterium]|nr:L,D-transpeptidase [Candidatus Roizmanbacteria bacterium]
MKKILIVGIFLFLGTIVASLYQAKTIRDKQNALSKKAKSSHWLLLKRKSNVELLYFGRPGNEKESRLMKTFKVNVGIDKESPTPLPQLLGRDYWLIIDKVQAKDNLETAPFFLTLDIPVSEGEPYGPTPYLECDGQCNWVLPGYFGLHGVNGDESKLSSEDPGSSGCVRHRDEDIAYLYKLFEPKKEEIRYYVENI